MNYNRRHVSPVENRPHTSIFNGRSLFFSERNTKLKPNDRLQKRKPLGYGTINTMSTEAHKEQQQLAHDETGDACESELSGRIIPVELEATSVLRQNRLLKSARLVGFGLLTFTAISVGVICIIGNGGTTASHAAQKQYMAASSRGSKGRTDIVLPKVKRPPKLDAVEDETVIRKLREEFHEWIHHHGRDYGSDSEKEKRFHIWKENHFRCVENIFQFQFTGSLVQDFVTKSQRTTNSLRDL